MAISPGKGSSDSGETIPQTAGTAASTAFSAEIGALEGDVHRLPWQDGLPEIIESSLQPYRDRLDNSHSAMCNALEIGVARR